MTFARYSRASISGTGLKAQFFCDLEGDTRW